MSDNRIRELLAELNRELRGTTDFDPDTRKLLRELNDDLDRLEDEEESAAIELANQLETRFAANHPVAARIARELADMLAKMGV